jgi:hypothetical protein
MFEFILPGAGTRVKSAGARVLSGECSSTLCPLRHVIQCAPATTRRPAMKTILCHGDSNTILGKAVAAQARRALQ